MDKQSKLRNQYCAVCGKLITFPAGVKIYKKKTCSEDCYKQRSSDLRTGVKRNMTDQWVEKVRKRNKLSRGKKRNWEQTPETLEKSSKFMKTERGKELQRMATQAALRSPISGRSESNCHGRHWVIQSPDGKTYSIDNLTNWGREHYSLFGFSAPEDSAKIYAGFASIKKSMKYPKKYRVKTYKQWILIDFSEENESYKIAKKQKNTRE